jgi:Amt family ammonium transporter
VEPFTEVGLIAEHYNRAMEGFQKNLVARTDYAAILDAVSDGLFLLDRDYRINAHYSQATERIFSRTGLAGVDLRDLLKPMLTEKTYAAVSEYVELLFDPKMRMRSLIQVNPLKEAEFYVDTGEGRFESRFLRLDFSRIKTGARGETVDKLMVVVRDLTEQTLARRETEAERQRSQGEMELFYRILHIDPELFSEFLEGMQEDLDDMNAALESEGGALEDRLLRMFRRVHSIKGNASLLELDFIAREAHSFEDRIEALRGRGDLDTADFLPLAVALSGLYGLLAQARRLADRLSGFRGEFAGGRSSEGELVALQLKKLVEGAAASMGKKARLDYERFSARELPASQKKKTRDALIQLVRNAVAHGIEAPELREAAGKDATGTIAISTKRERDVLAVTVRDDGAGVDFAALAAAVGLDPASPKDRTLLAALARGGSTAGEAKGMHAGRGVGLGLVKTVLEELRGTVVLRTRKGVFSEFTLRIPTSASGAS